MNKELKPFLLSYQDTRTDNPVEYKLVYAESADLAIKKLSNHVSKQPYGCLGDKCQALGITNHTIE